MPREKYAGTSRKLLLAFDVGTTFSGVSYSILDPGSVPEIRTVTRFPEQERVGGDSKIPTIVYYDQEGKVRAIGAETAREGVEGIAEDEGWSKAEWFKLHLRPRLQSSHDFGPEIPALPPNKTVVRVLADFLQYLYNCSKKFIQETHANGQMIWASLEKNVDFVLSHPNGWEGPQQRQMRRAAVLAGLISDNPGGHKRVSFVTEGEASLHYCIQNGLTTDAIASGAGVLIVDAGGGTIDISGYRHSANGKSFEEITIPQCHFQGSVFVTSRSRAYLEGLLRGSRFAEDAAFIANRFDKKTKLGFRNDAEPQFIQFTSPRIREPKLDIRSGQLKLPGSVVASFFEPSITCIIGAIEEQLRTSHHPISSIFLVGGFAASDWLFSKLKEALEPKGIEVCRPDSHVNKAVADGAASFYLDHSVNSRVSKVSYGNKCLTTDVNQDGAHERRHLSYLHPILKDPVLDNFFTVILPKGTQVSETKEFRRSFYRVFRPGFGIPEISSSIFCYRGDTDDPRWTDVEPEKYTVVGTVVADGSAIPRQEVLTGRTYHWRITYDIVMLFGLTELKAQICWMEDGIEKRGPAEIVYELDADE